MAKTKAKQIKSECCAPAAVDYQPSLYLDLEGRDVKQIEGLKLNEEVQILVTGRVKRLEQRKSMRYQGEGKADKEIETGSISIEGYKVQVVADEEDFATKNGVDD